MSRTPDEISAMIRATLATTEPALSCERGTPERKIIDACSEAISEGYVDMYLIGSLLDLDNKVGLELEQFVGIFGFGRLQGKKASGIVRMTITTPLTTDQLLPLGSQFYTRAAMANNAGDRLFFASTQAVTLTAGSLSVDVPVQCLETGTRGNVPPDSVTSFGSSIATSTVTNLVAFTGGVDVETDPELRQRFKDTLLRNIAGTSDWYRAICLQNNSVSRVEVFGPTTLYRTQISAPPTTKNLSTLVHQDVKYVWPEMESVFVNIGTEDEEFYKPGNDYTLNWPTFTRIANASGGQIDNGAIIDLEFQYVTRASRNDPPNGITNKVDVFVDGVDPVTVTERTVIGSSPVLVSSPSTDWKYTGNFERVGYTTTPQANSRFVRLTSVPVLSFPSTLTIGSSVYSEGTHYYLLRSTTTDAGSHREISGLEFPAGVSGPANGTQLTLTYIYNRVPELLTAVIDTSKQICTDVMVHQARWRYVVVCISVQYARTYSPTIVENTIRNQLTRYFSAMSYGQQVKITALLMAVQQVLGVENVTLTTDAENPTRHGVEVYTDLAKAATVYDTDFKIEDSGLPVLHDVRITRKAAI